MTWKDTYTSPLPCSPFSAPEVEGDSGFAAFGKPVPTERQVAALDCAVETMDVDPFLADPCVARAAMYVERDQISEAMTVLRNIVDETGVYRLLAVMCT